MFNDFGICKKIVDYLKDPDPNSPIDKKNPFGATIKAGGQVYYTDKDGNKKLSVINKVNEEGDWGNWDKTLASQFLSKQSFDLAKKQLNITYLNKQAEFNDIMSISNSEIRKKMLYSFADDCDASAVDLKAAAMPRQATQVLLPLSSMKENEIPTRAEVNDLYNTILDGADEIMFSGETASSSSPEDVLKFTNKIAETIEY